jgi:lactate permease
VMALYGGWRSVRALWPVLAIAGLSFGLAQFVASNYMDYTLTDVFAALGSLVATVLFLQVWRPAEDSEFKIERTVTAVRMAMPFQGATAVPGAAARTSVPSKPAVAGSRAEARAGARAKVLSNPVVDDPVPAATSDRGAVPAWQGWMPWVIVSVTVILWTSFKVAMIGQHNIPWPGLDNAVSITLYHGKSYGAVWAFQPLGTGTAILLAALLTALMVRLSPAEFVRCVGRTIGQIWVAVVTVMLVVALAYVMNYTGMAYTLGLAAASSGHAFILLSPFLGWIAVFLSGSDTSGNALFGNLQVVAARQLHLNPLLFAATNSSGGVLAKMISPQNIATGVSVTNLRGQEGAILARTFVHSIVLTLMLVLIVLVQQYAVPGIIPTPEGSP